MRSWTNRLRLEEFGRNESGASGVEFALVASCFIALCAGILVVGWGLQMRNELSHAADRVARFVVMKPTANTAEVEEELRDALPYHDADNLVVATSTSTSGTVNYRVVTLSYPFAFAIPFLPAETLTLTVSRRAPLI